MVAPKSFLHEELLDNSKAGLILGPSTSPGPKHQFVFGLLRSYRYSGVTTLLSEQSGPILSRKRL